MTIPVSLDSNLTEIFPRQIPVVLQVQIYRPDSEKGPIAASIHVLPETCSGHQFTYSTSTRLRPWAREVSARRSKINNRPVAADWKRYFRSEPPTVPFLSYPVSFVILLPWGVLSWNNLANISHNCSDVICNINWITFIDRAGLRSPNGTTGSDKSVFGRISITVIFHSQLMTHRRQIHSLPSNHWLTWEHPRSLGWS